MYDFEELEEIIALVEEHNKHHFESINEMPGIRKQDSEREVMPTYSYNIKDCRLRAIMALPSQQQLYCLNKLLISILQIKATDRYFGSDLS